MISSVLIIDDDAIVRKLLRRLLAAHSDFEVVGEAAGSEEALGFMAHTIPDLILLDVALPHNSGFQLLSRLPNPPAVIFITSSRDYAVAAFEVAAVDYLVKPVSDQRLAIALQRFREQRASHFPHPRSNIFVVNINGTAKSIHINEILYLKAEGNYSLVRLINGGSVSMHRSLRDWQNQLPEDFFFKVDRSLLINLQHVNEISIIDRDSGQLSFKVQVDPITLGRTGLTRLRQALKGR